MRCRRKSDGRSFADRSRNVAHCMLRHVPFKAKGSLSRGVAVCCHLHLKTAMRLSALVACTFKSPRWGLDDWFVSVVSAAEPAQVRLALGPEILPCQEEQ